MHRVLNDKSMDIEEKLHIYNHLTSRSGILVNKARYMFSPSCYSRRTHPTHNQRKEKPEKKPEDPIPLKMEEAIEVVGKAYHHPIKHIKYIQAKNREDDRLGLGNKTIDEEKLTQLLLMAVHTNPMKINKK